MPTYDYKCTSCYNTFEIFQKMNEEPLEKCPECNGTLKRLIGTGAGPIFKGSGFYHTDYKNINKSTTEEKYKPTTETKLNTPQEKKSTEKKDR